MQTNNYLKIFLYIIFLQNILITNLSANNFIQNISSRIVNISENNKKTICITVSVLVFSIVGSLLFYKYNNKKPKRNESDNDVDKTKKYNNEVDSIEVLYNKHFSNHLNEIDKMMYLHNSVKANENNYYTLVKHLESNEFTIMKYSFDSIKPLNYNLRYQFEPLLIVLKKDNADDDNKTFIQPLLNSILNLTNSKKYDTINFCIGKINNAFDSKNHSKMEEYQKKNIKKFFNIT
jgi:hypothetical protein